MVKSIYVHIPFCNNICTYCDFPKIYYKNDIINKYLDALKQEINDNYKNEVIDTIYIGGGTPSALDIEEIIKLLNIIKIFKLNNNYEFTFECNIESIDKQKLELLFNNGVNRLSIGVQTFNDNFLKLLGRKHTKEEVFDKIMMAKGIGFNNINIDLMYALPNETIGDLSNDIEEFFKLDIPHISCYSLIIEPHTKLYNDNTKYISEDLDYEMYKLINNKLKDNGFNHYEVSNYSKKGFESKHNLVYWNNFEYYGFGMGASGYINNIRYTNTFNINEYIDDYKKKKEYIELDYNTKLENEFILGFRKMSGINKVDFYNKYDFNITNIDIVNKLLEDKKLIDNNCNIFINPQYIYVSNGILEEFLDVDYRKLKDN